MVKQFQGLELVNLNVNEVLYAGGFEFFCAFRIARYHEQSLSGKTVVCRDGILSIFLMTLAVKRTRRCPALKANADIVVICSSDDESAEYAIPAFNYLAGRAMFVVAGNPACAEDLKAAGIENFIHVRVNQLETLKSFNQKLGI